MCQGNKSGEKYPEAVRSFCLSLHYLGPKSYRFVRSKFLNHLPHESTILKWYQNSDLDRSQGIGENALKILRERAEKREKDGKCPLICSLIFDEMMIKKHIEWCPSSQSYVGLTYNAADTQYDELPMAKEAIVFMISGVNEFFELPVAFYFIISLTAAERTNLVMKLITEITHCNVIISNLCFDGLTANATMCEMLGCSFKDEIKPYFTSTINNRPIYVIFDPSHMLKLLRNTIGNRKALFDEKGQKIDWNHFIALEKYSSENNFGLTHKLTKRHIQFETRKMHVETAAQTLSSSVANAMEFLMKSGVEQFECASETIKFIRHINHVFDVMNTFQINNNHGNPFKNALNSENQAEIFEFLQNAKDYFYSLHVLSLENKKKIRLIDSKVKTGCRGFVVNIISITAMYTEFVEQRHWLLFFATYRLSQDHIEMFFGKIRSSNGHNDNPTSKQFISSYRKLGLQADISISRKANIKQRGEDQRAQCVSNVLNISSSSSKNRDIAHAFPDEFDLPTEATIDLQHLTCANHLEEHTNQAGIIFVANVIEKKLLESDQIHCSLCPIVLEENEKVPARLCVMSDGTRPCNSTYDICKITENAMNQFTKESGELENQFKSRVFTAVLSNITIANLFPVGFSIEHDIHHKNFLIKFIMDQYMHIRSTHRARRLNLENEKEYIRSKLRKEIHFLNQ